MCFSVNVNLVKEELENRYGATLIDPMGLLLALKTTYLLLGHKHISKSAGLSFR